MGHTGNPPWKQQPWSMEGATPYPTISDSCRTRAGKNRLADNDHDRPTRVPTRRHPAAEEGVGFTGDEWDALCSVLVCFVCSEHCAKSVITVVQPEIVVYLLSLVQQRTFSWEKNERWSTTVGLVIVFFSFPVASLRQEKKKTTFYARQSRRAKSGWNKMYKSNSDLLFRTHFNVYDRRGLGNKEVEWIAGKAKTR